MNSTTETNSNTNKDTVIYIQRFTVSSISLLNLLQSVCTNQPTDKIQGKDRKAVDKFIESSQKFIDTMKNPDEDFDYTRFIKKAFSVLKTEEQCIQIKEKSSDLLNIRDGENKIVTILPGLDLKIGYKFLSESEKINFWQYMYLFIDSVFCLIKITNPIKFPKYEHVVETLKFIEVELSQTGIMFKDQIFNPFIGIGDNLTEYSVDQMFTGGELPKQHQMSIDTILSMMGVDKMFDETKINEQLKGIGEDQVNEATEKIIGLLGASDNKEIKDTCNTLIQDIVNNFKENGISNIGDTLKKVAENAKKTIDITKMKKTAESMKNFMANSQEKMKDLKDAKGNPIGQQMLNSMSVPLSMMNMMNIKSTGKDSGKDSDKDSDSDKEK
jgi:hypothetical protein